MKFKCFGRQNDNLDHSLLRINIDEMVITIPYKHDMSTYFFTEKIDEILGLVL